MLSARIEIILEFRYSHQVVRGLKYRMRTTIHQTKTLKRSTQLSASYFFTVEVHPDFDQERRDQSKEFVVHILAFVAAKTPLTSYRQ